MHLMHHVDTGEAVVNSHKIRHFLAGHLEVHSTSRRICIHCVAEFNMNTG